MKKTLLSAILLMTIGISAHAHAFQPNPVPEFVDLQSAIADLTLKIAYNTQNTLATPKYQRTQTTSAYIPLNDKISTHMTIGYDPANLARPDDQWSSTIGFTFTHQFTYKDPKPQQPESFSMRR